MPCDGVIVVVGVSHQTAALAAREQVALDDAGARAVLRDLRAAGAVHEAVALSTCNRTELYALAASGEQGERALRGALQQRTSLGAATLSCAAYALFEQDAVEHLFRVAAGLESAILGETEIAGQVRAAVRTAEQEGVVGPVLASAFSHALAAAGRVRRRTGISVGATSICSIVAELATGADSAGGGRRHVVLVGAGHLAHALAGALAAAPGVDLVIANRTRAAAQVIADRHGGVATALERLPEELRRADALVSATTAPHPVVSAAALQRAVARRPRRLTIVDLAVPRDVEPAAAALPGVTVHDIDALQRLVRRNLAVRRREAQAAAEMLRRETRRFGAWRRERDATSAVREVWRRAEQLRRDELARAGAGLTAAERERLDRVTSSLVRKLLRGPSERLRVASSSPAAAAHVESFRLLFDVAPTATQDAGENVVALRAGGAAA